MDTPNNLILLTGAGFSKNFGGFLAKEMWSKMFNHPLVSGCERIKTELLATDDFELAYSNIIDSDADNDIKEKMTDIISDAYQIMDRAIKTVPLMRTDTCNTYALNNDFLSFFLHRKDRLPGMFFTLNQDLLFERHYGYLWPGVSTIERIREPYVLHTDLSPGQMVTLNSGITKEQIINDFNNNDFGYFKLHGSYSWKSSGGGNQMVIGKNKIGSISKEPLLKAYFEILEEAIKTGNSKKLWVVGYGFGDQHINAILADGVQNHGLRIYLITTSDIATLKKNIGNAYTPIIIDQGLEAYFPYTLEQIYPYDQSIQTTQREEILNKLRA